MSNSTILYDTCRAKEKALINDLISSIRSLVKKHDDGIIRFDKMDLIIDSYPIGGIINDVLIHGNGHSEMYTIDKLGQYDLFRLLYLVESLTD